MKKMIKYNIDSNIRSVVFLIIVILSLIISYIFDAYIEKYSIEILNSKTVIFLISKGPWPTLMGSLWLLFDKYIWKLPIINNFIGVPNLNGYWDGEYISSFKCEDVSICECVNKDNCKFPIKGQERKNCSNSKVVCENYNELGKKGSIHFEIIQTFSKICIYSKNEKSKSYNRATSLLVEDFFNPVLLYEHFNEVDIISRDIGMMNHSGFNQLSYSIDDGIPILEGRYYNDQNRSTYGTVRYVKKKVKYYQ